MVPFFPLAVGATVVLIERLQILLNRGLGTNPGKVSTKTD
jgi:hypothetical protein